MEVTDIRTLIVISLLVLGLLCTLGVAQPYGSDLGSSTTTRTYLAYDWLYPDYLYRYPGYYYSWYPVPYYNTYPYVIYYYPYNYYYPYTYYYYPYTYYRWYPYTYTYYQSW